MNFLNKIFHLDDKKTNLKNELIGGLITFISLCYVVPVIASNLSYIGMDKQGVFVATSFLTALICLIMAFVANYPIVLSAGMGLNAYIAFSLSNSFSSWQQKMILLTICGILFFILSITPIRKWIINMIPREIKYIISAALGGFLFFVGLKGSGIIASSQSTLVKMGNLLDPSVMVAIISIFLTIAFMFSKNKILKTMAIPFGIIFATIGGLITSSIMYATGSIVRDELGNFIYSGSFLDGQITNLPIAPRLDPSLKYADISPIKNVFLYGLFTDSYSGGDFANDLVKVLTNPISYVAIFSIVFINIFDTTAAYISINNKLDILDEQGKIKRYHHTVMADATGSLLSASMGTSTIEPLAESNIGISIGARTGLSALTVGLLFFLSAFIYPIFSVFAASSVTACALVGIGLVVMSNSIIELDLKRLDIIFTFLVTFIFSILCYSISDGIGFSLITYCLINIVQGKRKELGLPLIIITILFIISLVAEAVINVI